MSRFCKLSWSIFKDKQKLTRRSGNNPHISHDGSEKEVISIRLLNDSGGRIETAHIEADRSVTVKKGGR